MLIIQVTNAREVLRREIGSLGERFIGRISDAEAQVEKTLINEIPAVAWMAYSIHGNETSGADAALGVIYHLIASKDDDILELLDDMVIIVDPVMNPDGRARFVKNLEQYRGTAPNYDDQSLLHTGDWPYGRTNHYYFDLNRDWLFRAPENTYSMIGAYTWQATGINMMIFLVGLQGLPKEPMEAAKIDGAKGFTLIFKIVIPMIMPYFVIASLLALINSFRIFDSVWVMTMGGPGRYSETLAVTMYREGFIIFDLGYAAAVAVLISLVGLVFSYYYLKSVLTKEDVS